MPWNVGRCYNIKQWHFCYRSKEAMYLASVLDTAVLFGFFEDQLTNLSPNSCIPPDVLIFVSWQPTWSASAKDVSAIRESFEYHRPKLMVPL
nr:hypothetical protein [Tanacetum cinerariifolium]